MRALALTLIMLALPTLAAALTPASPQPDPAKLKPGLHVEYVYPPEVKWLRDARAYKAGRKRGPDLTGLNYADTKPGEKALTSDQRTRVIAHIKGYVLFEKPGSHQLNFLTNDGLEIFIGGQEVGKFDGRQPCGETGVKTVSVPEAGYYELKALWFQRLETSCLQMKWRPPGGGMGQAPDAIFFHAE